MIVTIDGPAASGKSTISRILADKLGFYYLSSGLLYRAIAYLLINQYGYTLETLTVIRDTDLNECIDPQRFCYDYNEQHHEHIFFDAHDITPFLKELCIDQVTSIISIHKNVRAAVTIMQHRIASEYNSVIEGRDVGSSVFPDAQVKFFVTASVQVRAQRWQKDQEKYGNHFALDQAIALITERDNRDKNRDIAPLIIPYDAIVIDTSDLNVQQVVEKMLEVVNSYL